MNLGTFSACGNTLTQLVESRIITRDEARQFLGIQAQEKQASYKVKLEFDPESAEKALLDAKQWFKCIGETNG